MCANGSEFYSGKYMSVFLAASTLPINEQARLYDGSRRPGNILTSFD